MGLLDSFLKGGSGGPLDSLVSYTVAPTSTLLNESFSKVSNTFGGIGSFTKLTGGAPTFSSLAGAAAGFVSSNPFSSIASSLSNAETSTVSAGEVNGAVGSTAKEENTYHKVRLISKLDDTEFVIFDIMPEISEQRNAEYEALQPSQLPGEFQKYKGTKSTTWAINATFTCRTRGEAKQNYDYLNLLRSWTMPFFGERQGGTGRLGAPPPVLSFSGWRGLVGGSDGDNGGKNSVPVVVTSLQWNWPKDCDWLPTGVPDPVNGQEIPFPTVMTLTINLVESYSPEQLNGFNLAEFRAGNMIGAFEPIDRGTGQTVDEANMAETTRFRNRSLSSATSAEPDASEEDTSANDAEIARLLARSPPPEQMGS